MFNILYKVAMAIAVVNLLEELFPWLWFFLHKEYRTNLYEACYSPLGLYKSNLSSLTCIDDDYCLLEHWKNLKSETVERLESNFYYQNLSDTRKDYIIKKLEGMSHD